MKKEINNYFNVTAAINNAAIYRPQQHRNEIFDFLKFISDRGTVKNVLEVGCGTGGTTFIFSQLFEKVVGVDRTPPIERVSANQTFIKMDTQNPTQEGLAQLAELYPFDLIFIDGLHTKEGVKKDYELFKPLLAPNGVLAFHDVKPSKGNDIVKGLPVHSDYKCTVSDFIEETDFTKEFKNTKSFIDYTDTWMARRVCNMTNFCGILALFND